MDIINIDELIKNEEPKDEKKDEKKDDPIEAARELKGFALHPDFIKAYGGKK